MTVTQFYEQSVRSMPPADRLSLAKLILNEIAPEMLVDYSDWWSETDLAEFSQATWKSTSEDADGGA